MFRLIILNRPLDVWTKDIYMGMSWCPHQIIYCTLLLLRYSSDSEIYWYIPTNIVTVEVQKQCLEDRIFAWHRTKGIYHCNRRPSKRESTVCARNKCPSQICADVLLLIGKAFTTGVNASHQSFVASHQNDCGEVASHCCLLSCCEGVSSDCSLRSWCGEVSSLHSHPLWQVFAAVWAT